MKDSTAGFAGLVLLGILVLFCFATFRIPNSGQHTGYVTSVEQSGLIWKTWTAYIKTDPQSSQEDAYCVTNPDTVTRLQDASTKRSSVTVFYSAPIFLWRWQCGGESSIIQIVDTSATTSSATSATDPSATLGATPMPPV